MTHKTPGNLLRLWADTRQRVGTAVITRADILDFAQKFDPQPFHLDEEAARRSLLGGLAASGWQSCALQHRLFSAALLAQNLRARCTEIVENRWAKPLRPDTQLAVEIRSVEQHANGGFILSLDLIDLANGAIMSQTSIWNISGTEPPPPMPALQAPRPVGNVGENPGFEAIGLGLTVRLGTYQFNEDNIARFAAAYDPLVAADIGSASPWQVAGGWMFCRVTWGEKSRAAALEAGRTPAQLGPSPGFNHLRWFGKVSAGETLTYYETPQAMRQTSRAGWALLTSQNEGFNAQGLKVFEFTAQVFVAV